MATGESPLHAAPPGQQANAAALGWPPPSSVARRPHRLPGPDTTLHPVAAQASFGRRGELASAAASGGGGGFMDGGAC